MKSLLLPLLYLAALASSAPATDDTPPLPASVLTSSTDDAWQQTLTDGGVVSPLMFGQHVMFEDSELSPQWSVVHRRFARAADRDQPIDTVAQYREQQRQLALERWNRVYGQMYGRGGSGYGGDGYGSSGGGYGSGPVYRF